MADMPKGTQIRSDETGIARSIRLPRSTEAAAEAFARATRVPTTVRELADNFVIQASPLLRLDQGNLAAFAPSDLRSAAAPADKMQVGFREEKDVSGSATVVYDQKVLGLPVWNSGLTVQIATGSMRVLSSQNQLDYDIEIDRLPEAGLLPDVMTADRLAPLLGLPSAPPDLVINGTSQLIYRYQAAERLDPALQVPDPAPMQSAPPTLPLPPLPESIVEGRHYVVTEVLFTLPLPSQGSLNWRAFIEPTTATVLYLRALVACLHGAVFLTDTTLPDGRIVSVDCTKDELNSVRSVVPLAGLNAPSESNAQRALKGEFVELRETSQPIVPAPVVTPPSDFVYDVPTSDFAAVCAYHHCDGLFRLVEGMGIDVRAYFDGTNFPVPVDHYGFDKQVNARAPSNTMGNGSGGFEFGLAKAGQPIGIAVTARVALHEFGHALLWDHVRSPNFGFAHSAGDSLAAILHDPISQLPDRFDTFPFMTASGMGLRRRHDRRVEQGWAWGGRHDDTQYHSEQVLSTTLFRIYRAAGGDSTDTAVRQAAARYVAFLIIKAIGLLSFTTPDPEVYVDALMDADASTLVFEGWPGGTLYKVIRWSFEQQGLFQRPGAPRHVVSKGRPPEVDVFIDDARLGEYMPYLADAGQSRGIWNRRSQDDGLEDEPIAAGAENFLYVRVRNRGFGTAANITVRAYQRSGDGDTWPSDWRPAGDPVSIDAIASGGEAIAGPIRWQPAQSAAKLLTVVAADDDASILETVAGPASIATLIPVDNNLGHRSWAPAVS